MNRHTNISIKFIGVADNFIFLDESTSFNGTITAKEVIVGGSVNGDINASDQILIKKGATVKGSLQTQKLLFEEGGQHKGLIRLWSEPEVSKSITNESLEQSINGEPVNKPEEDKRTVEQNSEERRDKPLEDKKAAAERLW